MVWVRLRYCGQPTMAGQGLQEPDYRSPLPLDSAWRDARTGECRHQPAARCAVATQDLTHSSRWIDALVAPIGERCGIPWWNMPASVAVGSRHLPAEPELGIPATYCGTPGAYRHLDAEPTVMVVGVMETSRGAQVSALLAGVRILAHADR
jgi:hypothetical protein